MVKIFVHTVSKEKEGKDGENFNIEKRNQLFLNYCSLALRFKT